MALYVEKVRDHAGAEYGFKDNTARDLIADLQERVDDISISGDGSGIEFDDENEAMVVITTRDGFNANSQVNVLSLGAKNDGSADCSAIINEATVEHELYFPTGVYRVDNPLVLQHSIYGSGNDVDFVRNGTPRNGTTLYSNISSTNQHGVIEISGRHANISNLNIRCNSDECGILINTDIGNERLVIDNVTIYNVGDSYGIDCSPTSTSSKILDGRDVCIFGRGLLSESVGLRIGSNAYDSIARNFTIHAVQKGIINYAFLRIEGGHIWNGVLVDDENPTWWDDTVAVEAHDKLQVTGLYADTSAKYFRIATDKQVSFYNIMVWSADGQTGGSTSDQVVFYVDDSYLNNTLVTVDGATICDDGKLTATSINLFDRLGARFSNIHIISDRDNIPSDAVMGVVGRLYREDFFVNRPPASKYVEIANIAGTYGGSADIEIRLDNNVVKVSYVTSRSPKFVKTVVYGDLSVYYKSYTSGIYTNYKLYVYVPIDGGMSVFRRCAGNAYMTSYYSSKRTNEERLVPEELSSSTGLTEVTTS